MPSPYDENWLLDFDCLAMEIRLNDPRTTSVVKPTAPDPIDIRREKLRRQIADLRKR